MNDATKRLLLNEAWGGPTAATPPKVDVGTLTFTDLLIARRIVSDVQMARPDNANVADLAERIERAIIKLGKGKD